MACGRKVRRRTSGRLCPRVSVRGMLVPELGLARLALHSISMDGLSGATLVQQVVIRERTLFPESADCICRCSRKRPQHHAQCWHWQARYCIPSVSDQLRRCVVACLSAAGFGPCLKAGGYLALQDKQPIRGMYEASVCMYRCAREGCSARQARSIPCTARWAQQLCLARSVISL